MSFLKLSDGISYTVSLQELGLDPDPWMAKMVRR